MKKTRAWAIIILMSFISFPLTGADINAVREKYLADAAVKLIQAWADVNKKLIPAADYSAPSNATLEEFHKAYDKVKTDLTEDINKQKELSENEKASLVKTLGSFTDEKYNAVLRTYQSTPEAWADFAKQSDAILADIRKDNSDTKKIDSDLKSCTDKTLDAICSYAQKIIKDAKPRKNNWELDRINKVSVDTSKMKLDARDNLQSTGYFYSADMKKLITLYNDRIIDSFRDMAVFILRDAIAAKNALKDKDSLLSTVQLGEKYKFPTEFAGLYLGDTKDNCLKLFANSKLISHKIPDATNWADIYAYEGNPQLKEVSSTILYFAENLLVKVELYFVPAQGVSVDSLFDQVRALLENKYGVFALIYSRDTDPDNTIIYRDLTPQEEKENPKKRNCVKYIWEGANDYTQMNGSARGNMVIKIRETNDGKVLVIANHETLLQKFRDKFNLKKEESYIGSF